jgi:hypothetical protein
MATEMLGIKYNPRNVEFFFDLKGSSESQASSWCGKELTFSLRVTASITQDG